VRPWASFAVNSSAGVRTIENANGLTGVSAFYGFPFLTQKPQFQHFKDKPPQMSNVPKTKQLR